MDLPVGSAASFGDVSKPAGVIFGLRELLNPGSDHYNALNLGRLTPAG